MITKITPQRFFKYQATFARIVKQTPAECFVVFKEITSAGGFSDFVGDSKRKLVPIKVPCLYRRTISSRDREKFGFDLNTTGVVWVSPQHLAKAGAPTKFKTQDVHIELHGEEFGVGSIIYRAPFYGSYIAVELQLEDYSRM